MKTFKIFTAILFLVATIVSCNKDQIDKQFLTSSDGTIVVPGANNGGNITCEEVASVTGCTFDYSVKKDYYGGSEVQLDLSHGGQMAYMLHGYPLFR
jgi:hypothetical protein